MIMVPIIIFCNYTVEPVCFFSSMLFSLAGELLPLYFDSDVSLGFQLINDMELYNLISILFPMTIPNKTRYIGIVVETKLVIIFILKVYNPCLNLPKLIYYFTPPEIVLNSSA